MNDSQKLFRNIKKARLINTFGSLFCVGVIGLIVYLHNEGISFSFGPIGTVTVLFAVISICIAPLIIKSKEATSPKCPRCKQVVEKNKLLGEELPDSCPNCGLMVEEPLNRV